eukprot:TRINITY_DN9036_c0_g1_i1.p1 TRINITY_DN9036_c0_g1~~TRINITY_DN9036_c0_g1_i1.p1  ORF type:complete len:176 (+),score=24.29 TRINITY_DN9036_c0_g1_i1:394-921(+)
MKTPLTPQADVAAPPTKGVAPPPAKGVAPPPAKSPMKTPLTPQAEKAPAGTPIVPSSPSTSPQHSTTSPATPLATHKKVGAAVVEEGVEESSSPPSRVNYWADIAAKVLSDGVSGWRAVPDPKSGRTYFSNKKLGKTTWNLERELYNQYQERKKKKDDATAAIAGGGGEGGGGGA